MNFNDDGSLKVTRVKQDHLPIFNLLDEIEFPVGKKLLIQLLQGDESLRIKRLDLHKKVYHGSLGGFDEKQLTSFIDHLINTGFLSVSNFKPMMPVLKLTEKAYEELEERNLEFSIENISQPSTDIKNTDDDTTSASQAPEFPSFEKATLTESECHVCDGLSFFFSQFTDEQKKAIVDMHPRQACIAGAGSGKTSVLTHKIAYLVNYAGVPAEDILAITFTRKARREMSSRLKGLLGADKEVRVETFNSFAEKELLYKGKGHSDFDKRMISNSEFIRIVTQAVKDCGLDMKSFLDEYFTPRERKGKEENELFFSFLYDFRAILDEFDACDGNHTIFKNRIAEGKINERRTASHVLNIAATVSHTIKENGFRTYSDQIPDVTNLFKTHPELTPSYSWILVDEYQDVSVAQKDLLKLLAPDHLFVVGDPRQSIFAWRDADPSVMLDFVGECSRHNGAVMELSTNFRSCPEILDFANSLISKAHGGKNPYTPLTAFKDQTGKVSIESFKSDTEEAEHIINTILESDLPRNSIFILSRTNKGLEKVKTQCQNKNIRYMLRTEEKSKASEDPDPDQITLSTVHAIKGLEADLVFVINATSLNYPCKAKDHRFVRLLCAPTEYDSYEEERRLFYVACTRASTRLQISYTGPPSPFIPDTHKNTSQTSTQSISLERLETQRKALKRWRFLEAKERSVSAYVIFSNNVLEQLLERQPSTISELYSIKGMGASKVEEFGDDIIHLIKTN